VQTADLTIFFQILGVSPDANPDEIKKAYRKLVRENHPDLFPEAERPQRDMRMMQINEAYLQIKKFLREPQTSRSPTPVKKTDNVPAASSEIGLHNDPAYAYYKQGFIHYSRGVGGIMDREKNRKLTLDAGGLKRTIYALKSFHTAHSYFLRVVREYPESIWKTDAEWKLKRIEGFNRIYRKIRKNLEERLRQ